MTQIESFVNEFCNHAAVIFRSFPRMRAFYIWGDPRPGTPMERLDHDSKQYAEFQKLFQP